MWKYAINYISCSIKCLFKNSESLALPVFLLQTVTSQWQHFLITVLCQNSNLFFWVIGPITGTEYIEVCIWISRYEISVTWPNLGWSSHLICHSDPKIYMKYNSYSENSKVYHCKIPALSWKLCNRGVYINREQNARDFTWMLNRMDFLLKWVDTCFQFWMTCLNKGTIWLAQ